MSNISRIRPSNQFTTKEAFDLFYAKLTPKLKDHPDNKIDHADLAQVQGVLLVNDYIELVVSDNGRALQLPKEDFDNLYTVYQLPSPEDLP